MDTSLANKRRTKGTRFFVEWSSWFDTHKYDVKKITAAVKAAGGMNIRLSNFQGWTNQPKVVCFTVPDTKTKDRVSESVSKALKTPWIIVSAKWW